MSLDEFSGTLPCGGYIETEEFKEVVSDFISISMVYNDT